MISGFKKTLAVTLYDQQISSVGYQIHVREMELGISVHLARNVCLTFIFMYFLLL